MCVDAKCENRTEVVKLAPKCDPESCNDAGICNNMGNCHCRPGYGGTSCAIPGPGGSVNSGPATEGSVIHVGYVVFWLLFISAVVFIVASIFIKRKKNIWLHKQYGLLFFVWLFLICKDTFTGILLQLFLRVRSDITWHLTANDISVFELRFSTGCQSKFPID